jgi:hypothetical protein
MMPRCAQCGAPLDDGRTCEDRFAVLLALDHSREEPWGSRHGLAFATFALQHPASYDVATLDRAWVALYRVYVLGDDARRLFQGLAGRRVDTTSWDAPPRPPVPARLPSVTIVELGDFDADRYAADVDAWARATVAAWGGDAIARRGLSRT